MTLEDLLRVRVYTALVVGAAIASATPAPASASAAPVLPTPGDNIGEVQIRPVESNIATKFWTSVEVSSGDSTASAVADEDTSTAWFADPGDAPARLTLDLGGAYDNLRKVEVIFPDRAAYRYLLEASSDGEAWETLADRSRNATPSRGSIHLFTRPGTRFLRVTINGASSSARLGLSEIRAFNYLRDDLVLGADLSMIDNFQDRDYYVSPNPSLENMGAGPHLLDVGKDRGMEYIRLRIFNEPRDERTGEPRTPPTQGPERSLESAKRVKERALGLGIDFHYADSWADPGKQPKPRAWAELEFDELAKALHDFTFAYLRDLVVQGTVPDKVAVGNEVINGFLWGSESAETYGSEAEAAEANPPYFRDQAAIYQSRPGGRILWRYWKSDDPIEQRKYDQSWERFATLVAAGISAVREASPQSRVEIHTIVESNAGGRSGIEKTMEFWRQLLTRVNASGQDPDVLAISYYPEWHGTVEQLDSNLHTIATAYPRYDVEIAETAYPASGGTPQPNATFPRTIQGQAEAIQRVFQAANDVIDNRGIGVLLWEPASFQTMFRPVPEMPNYFQPFASIDVFNRSHARHVLEDRVYLSVEAGQAPALPASVHVLTTADGSIASARVAWDPLPPGATATPGTLSLNGKTPSGTVAAIIDVVARR